MNRYAIVTGQGRSGTNWVLDVLDASQETFCRNEPNVIPGSPFERLPPLWRLAEGDKLNESWDSVARETCMTTGERDHRLKVNKHYLHDWAHKAGLPPLMARPKIRSALGKTILRDLDGHIWDLPSLIGSQERLEEACTIIKVNQVPLLIQWILAERQDVPVVNIVRHPCGRHASFAKRYLSGADADAELALTRDHLRVIASDDEVWRDRFGSIDEMGHVASQTWMWRFVNESIEEFGVGKPQFMRIIFEEMTADPMPHAKAIYELFGLEWTSEVSALVEQGLEESVWGKLDPAQVASAWRKSLSNDEIDEIETILADSPMAVWWA